MRKKIRNIVLLGGLLVALIGGGCSTGTNIASGPMLAEEFLSDSADAEVKAAFRLIEQTPGSSMGYVRLASVYIKKARETGDFSLNKKAETAVMRALELEPESVPALKLKASLLATFHRFDEARELAERLKKQIPNDAFVYGVLTDAAVELGDYEAAIEAAQKMVDLKPNTASYARIGHLRSLHGDHTGAIEMLTLAARVADPQDKESQSWCLVQLGTEYFKRGDLTRAEKAIDESLQISPGYNPAMIEKARIRAAQGAGDAALQYLTQVQESAPSPEALILAGDINYRLGLSDAAEANYRSAEELARQFDGDMHRFSLLWADHNTRLDGALKIAEEDYATNKDIYAADIFAWCLLRNGRASEAKAVIKNALRLDSKDARILYHAGMIEKELGNKKDALRLLEEALRLNPSFDLLQAENARKELQNLRSS